MLSPGSARQMVLEHLGQNIYQGTVLYIIEQLPSELMASSSEPSTLQSQVLVKYWSCEAVTHSKPVFTVANSHKSLTLFQSSTLNHVGSVQDVGSMCVTQDVCKIISDLCEVRL